MIEVNDLHKSFGKVKVLNGIHLEYHPGKIYGLVGENWSRKDYFIQLYNGNLWLYRKHNQSKTLKTGYLSASNFFYSQNHGSWTLGILYEGQRSAGQYPTIQHLNEIFQLPLDRYAAEYSTGMKRNWDLWHYCCKTMTYLFLTSRSMGWTWRDVSWWKDSSGNWKQRKTVIISSHLIASLREICDIIHYLNEGGIYKEYHEETTEEIEEDILCNTKKIQPTSYFQ